MIGYLNKKLLSAIKDKKPLRWEFGYYDKYYTGLKLVAYSGYAERGWKMTTAYEILESIREVERRLDSTQRTALPPPFKLVQNANLTETFQYRFPRCKSKRIAKKWRKNTMNFKTIPSDKVYILSDLGCMICHPEMVKQMELQMKQTVDMGNYDLMPKGILGRY